MAVRLATVFGGDPGAWLTRQMQYDLSHANERLANVEIAALTVHPITEQQARLF